MEKPDFYKILCTSTPEEINEFISSKGKKKMVNAITFLDEEYSKSIQKSCEQTKSQTDIIIMNK